MLYDYFFQNFAQVTNPPIDPIREELVMSLVSFIGPRPDLMDVGSGGEHKRLEVDQPILSNIDLERIRRIENHVDGSFRTYTLDITYRIDGDEAETMEAAVERICSEAQKVVENQGYNIIILSDRNVDAEHVAIPALLATGAVHHHLIREGLRTEVGLVVETGEARRVHDFCLLAGYGAEAMNPYLAFDTLSNIVYERKNGLDEETAHKNFIKAVGKGMMKVMSKMGISTYQSYCGAQIFDAVGLSSDFIEAYFTGTATKVEGAGLREIAEETERRHALAFGDAPLYRGDLDVGGDLAFRLRGEEHVWTPETIGTLQHAVRSANYNLFKTYTSKVNDQTKKLKNLRGLFDIKSDREPISIDEVEPISEIVKRFATGAMSFGSISWEAHTTLAIAMNRLGGRSNTGEGGEEAVRFGKMENGDLHAVADQTGGVWAFRRYDGISGQFRRYSDQDGARGEAGRRRSAAGPQGRRVDCAGAPFDAGRRSDFAAAASRYLFDRGSGAAHSRFEERQSSGAHLGEACLRNRRGHNCGWRQQGLFGPCDHLWARWRYGRQSVDLSLERGRTVGVGSRRDASNAGDEWFARPDRRAGRRWPADRTRRNYRCIVGGR